MLRCEPVEPVVVVGEIYTQFIVVDVFDIAGQGVAICFIYQRGASFVIGDNTVETAGIRAVGIIGIYAVAEGDVIFVAVEGGGEARLFIKEFAGSGAERTVTLSWFYNAAGKQS